MAAEFSARHFNCTVIVRLLCAAAAFFSTSTVAAQCPATELAHLFASDGSPADTFGYRVAIDGDTLVVGSHNDDTAAAELVGSAYVFEYVDSAWVETAHLFAPDGGYLYNFGSSVAI